MKWMGEVVCLGKSFSDYKMTMLSCCRGDLFMVGTYSIHSLRKISQIVDLVENCVWHVRYNRPTEREQRNVLRRKVERERFQGGIFEPHGSEIFSILSLETCGHLHLHVLVQSSILGWHVLRQDAQPFFIVSTFQVFLSLLTIMGFLL